MIRKIDINSEEFITEFELTKNFTDKVCEQFGFAYNPEDDVNESVQQGLSRNKIIYNKRYCPCFMVKGVTKEEQKKEDNRICPCKPALEVEIPNDGKCRCGIFCTPEYVKQLNSENNTIQNSLQEHSSGLTQEDARNLLQKKSLDAQEVESLLEARQLGLVDFLLVDTREWMEWVGQRIKGTDFLVPTTSFYQALQQIEDKKETPIIVYCLSGSRSAYCQNIMLTMGYKSVSNLHRGIMTYQGESLSGE